MSDDNGIAIGRLRAHGNGDGIRWACASCGARGGGVFSPLEALKHHETKCPGEPPDENRRLLVESIADRDRAHPPRVIADPRAT